MRHAVLLGLVSFLAFGVGARTHAQGTNPNDSLTRTAPLSLQSQLGAIPLVSPRAAAQASRLRTVRLTQVAKDGPAGEPRDIACPETGCQQLVNLVVGGSVQVFLADIQFVSHGAYVTLQSRSAAIAQVVEFHLGRPGPVFIKGPADTVLEQRVSYVATPTTTLRRLDAAVQTERLAGGNLYARKQEPDLMLKIEIQPSKFR